VSDPSLAINECVFDGSERSKCVMGEGRSVHLACSARRNPPIATVAWQPSTGNGSLYIASTNHTLHTGYYRCDVTTGMGNLGNHQRLPLKADASVLVLETCRFHVYDIGLLYSLVYLDTCAKLTRADTLCVFPLR
jgi:hypothetical protein